MLPGPIGYYWSPGSCLMCVSLSSHRRGAGVCPEEPRTLGSSAHFSVSNPGRSRSTRCIVSPITEYSRREQGFAQKSFVPLSSSPPLLPHCSSAGTHSSSSSISRCRECPEECRTPNSALPSGTETRHPWSRVALEAGRATRKESERRVAQATH